MIRSYLYDENGSDGEIDLDDVSSRAIAENQILWIDLQPTDADEVARVACVLEIEPRAFVRLFDQDREQHLDNYGGYYAFGVRTFTGEDEADENGLRPSTVMGFIVGKGWLVTTHLRPVAFVEAFQAQDKGETRIGVLPPALLAVSLLDWHLAEFFREVALIEKAVDELDEQILAEGTQRDILRQIVAALAHVSKLRAMIAGQRPVLYGLSRPDFTIGADPQTASEMARLAARFDRAVDEVERSRDVVVGSFDLFTSMTTQKTNDLVKALTFLTAIIGVCAAAAGILGMNFDAPFFETGMMGFVVAVAGMALVAVLSVLVARWRRWI